MPALTVKVPDDFLFAVTSVPCQGMDLFVSDPIIDALQVWTGIALGFYLFSSPCPLFPQPPRDGSMRAGFNWLIPGVFLCHTKGTIFLTLWLHYPRPGWGCRGFEASYEISVSPGFKETEEFPDYEDGKQNKQEILGHSLAVFHLEYEIDRYLTMSALQLNYQLRIMGGPNLKFIRPSFPSGFVSFTCLREYFFSFHNEDNGKQQP